MPVGLQEGDIKAALADGGRILNVIIICRSDAEGCEHIPYFHTSWGRGFRALRTWADKGDRTYRDLNRLLALVRSDFEYKGYIVLYLAGDAELARYKGLADVDRRIEIKIGSND